MANKLYEVIREHPNKDAQHDITISGIRYKKGDKVGFNIYVKENGSEKAANAAIKRAIGFKWIKPLGTEDPKDLDLVDMTKKQLVAHAEENGIVLGNPKAKNEDIVAEIELALEDTDPKDLDPKIEGSES